MKLPSWQEVDKMSFSDCHTSSTDCLQDELDLVPPVFSDVDQRAEDLRVRPESNIKEGLKVVTEGIQWIQSPCLQELVHLYYR